MTRAMSSHAAQVDVMEAPKKQKGRAQVVVKVVDLQEHRAES